MSGEGRAPHPGLRDLVTAYHGYRYVGMAPGTHHGLPSLSLTAVIAFDEPLDVAWRDDEGSRGSHWSMVSGLHVVPALIRHTGFQHGVQLDLTPRGARMLLGAPAGAVAGTLLPWDLSAAYDDLAGASSWDRRFALLDELLLSRAADLGGCAGTVRPELREVWRRIRRSRGAVRVGDLATEVGWSRSRLTRRFTDEFGIGPKHAARVERFQWARVAVTAGARLADVAALCGYADQAHLARDFADLGGCTPTDWRRESDAFVQDRDHGPPAG